MRNVGKIEINMLKRITLSYLGTGIILICFLPVAAKWTMGGHSILYLIVFGSLVGITGGLCYSDLRQRYFLASTIVRSISGLFVAVLTVIALSQIQVSPFWTNRGFVLIPVLAPLLAAIASSLILARHVRTSR
jgi:ABC-type Na+ efflux pump permease subunit